MRPLTVSFGKLFHPRRRPLNCGRGVIFILLFAVTLSTVSCNEEPAVLPGIVRSSLSVSTYPEGAKIYLNNMEKIQLTPADLDDIEPGFYRLEIKLNNYLDTVHYVLLKRGLQDKLYFEMREDPKYWWYSFKSSNSSLPNTSLNKIRIDNFDRKYFATDYHGLAILSDSVWTFYNPANSAIPADVITDIYPASDGTVWLTSPVGIIKFSGNGFTLFNSLNSNLPDDYITSVAEGKDKVMWFGCREGGLLRYDGINFINYNTDNSGLHSNRISALACDTSGTVYIGTAGKGVTVFTGSNWRSINSLTSGLISDYITRLLIKSDGTLWIGSGYVSSPGGLTRVRGSQLVNYIVRSADQSARIITDIAFDLKGDVWISTADQGLFYFINNRFIQYNRTNSGIISNDALSVAVDKGGNKWVTSQGVSVYSGRK